MDLLGLGRSGLFPALRKNFQLLAAVSGACEMMEASPIGWLVFGTLSSPGVGTSLIEGEDTGCLKGFSHLYTYCVSRFSPLLVPQFLPQVLFHCNHIPKAYFSVGC